MEIPLTTGRGATMTVKLCDALRFGRPLSITTTPIVFVAGAVGGVHVNAPLPEPICAPAGALLNANVSDCGGRSVSVALAVKLSVCPSVTTRFVIGVRAGAVFGTRLGARGVGVGIE